MADDLTFGLGSGREQRLAIGAGIGCKLRDGSRFGRLRPCVRGEEQEKRKYPRHLFHCGSRRIIEWAKLHCVDIHRYLIANPIALRSASISESGSTVPKT